MNVLSLSRLLAGCLLLACCLMATPVQGTTNVYLTADFESGLTGWNTWVASGFGGASAANESPALGTGPENNSMLAQVTGQFGFIGGIWATVNVPIGVPLQIDGFWRSEGNALSSLILYDFDGSNAPVDGVDLFAPSIYASGAGAYSGIMFDTAQSSHPFGGPLGNGSQTGQLIALLRVQAGSEGGTAQFDDIWLQRVPEPGSLALVAVSLMGIWSLVRRRKGNIGGV